MPPLPHAQKYLSFHRAIFDQCAETPTPWPPHWTELDFQSLWFAGEFGNHFTCTQGNPINIQDFGTWNHSAGPDFTQTCIQINGQTFHGDIELDPDIRDWERHGHGSNPNYNHVILHVFLHQTTDQFFTRTSQHQNIPQLHLLPHMLTTGAQPKRQAEARLGRCATPLADMDDATVHSLLNAAAQYRLQQKADRLSALYAIHGRNQTLFQSLAATFGYRPNQRPFIVLAQRLPLKTLLKKSALEREALLFGIAGFLEPIKDKDTTPETRQYLRSLWSEWWKRRHAYESWLTPDKLPKWKITGSRPGNHPQRRLGALTILLNHWKTISSQIQPDQWSRKKFISSLTDLSHPYWNHHYTLLANPNKNPVSLIGITRIHELLANIIYPWLIPQNPKLWEEYQQLHAVLDNQKIRRAALRLFGTQNPRSKLLQKYLHQQQGLLQLYEDYCLEDDSSCHNCPFPERLREWR